MEKASSLTFLKMMIVGESDDRSSSWVMYGRFFFRLQADSPAEILISRSPAGYKIINLGFVSLKFCSSEILYRLPNRPFRKSNGLLCHTVINQTKYWLPEPVREFCFILCCNGKGFKTTTILVLLIIRGHSLKNNNPSKQINAYWQSSTLPALWFIKCNKIAIVRRMS